VAARPRGLGLGGGLSRNVSLTKELEEFVSKKLRSGRYSSASEVIREGLRLLDREDEIRELQKEELRAAIAQGARQLDRGEMLPGREVFAKVRRKIQARRKAR
jgi:antitoxin ParD1/3/4